MIRDYDIPFGGRGDGLIITKQVGWVPRFSILYHQDNGVGAHRRCRDCPKKKALGFSTPPVHLQFHDAFLWIHTANYSEVYPNPIRYD